MQSTRDVCIINTVQEFAANGPWLEGDRARTKKIHLHAAEELRREEQQR